MKKRILVVGLDGGATKTAAVLTDESGATLARSVTGPSNFQIVGTEEAGKSVLKAIEDCCAAAGRQAEDLDAVVAGLTGAGRETDQKRMAETLIRIAASRNLPLKNLHIVSDAIIALEGAFRGAPGMILIAGTGSIALGKKSDGSVVRAGGWGRIIGDEGSGYAIGRAGMTAVCRHLDGRGPGTSLTAMVAATVGLSTQEEIIRHVYRKGFDLASIAPLVFQSAGNGDAVCLAILQDAAADLVDHVGAVIRHMGIGDGRARLAFAGGLLTGAGVLPAILRRRLAEQFPSVTIHEPELPPEVGAALMAAKSLSSSPTSGTISRA